MTNCNQCNNLGLVTIVPNGYGDPIWNSPDFRVAVTNSEGHNIVINCQCREGNPVIDDDLCQIVHQWVQEGKV